jgi:pyroglutamyl-peptidase
MTPVAAACLLLLLVPCLAACGEPAGPLVRVSDLRDVSRRTILVTGFGPFLDVKENPSWEAIRDLDGTRIGGARIAVARLDVTYASAAEQLQAAIDRVRPDVVLALGVAPDSALRLETTARNLDTAASPDVAGEVRAGRKVRADGPATLPSRLPLEALRAALEADGFEVRASDDAGGYLCNHLFYELLTRRPTGVAGFVHVPELRAPWDLPRLQRAVRRMLETLARG